MSTQGEPRHAPTVGPVSATSVTLSVVSYATRYQTLVSVPADVPVRTLVGQLGGPVGVSQVSDLLLIDGTAVPPDSTLEEVGVGNGNSILVVSVYDTRPSPGTRAGSAVAATSWPDRAETPPVPELPHNAARPSADDPMWGVTITPPDVEDSPPPVVVPPANALAGDVSPDGATDAGEPDGATDADEPPDAVAGGAAGPGTSRTEPEHPATAPASGPASHPRRGLRRAVGIGTAVAVVTLGAGVLIGRATAPSPATPGAAILAAANQAAVTWMHARRYPATMVAEGAVPAAGRTGGLQGATRTVGWAKAGSHTDVWFIVTPAHKAPVGLTVELDGSKVAAAPTVSPVPFGGGQLPPQAPASPARAATIPEAVSRWAQNTFGPNGQLTATLGVGLAGHPQIVKSAKVGPGATVYRVRISLSSAAPGTAAWTANRRLADARRQLGAASRALAAARSDVTAARSKLAADNRAVSDSAALVTKDEDAVRQATATSKAADLALAQVTAQVASAQAANATTPPPPTPVPVPDVTPAQAKATAATETLVAVQAQEAKDRPTLVAAQAQQAKDRTALAADQAKLSGRQSSVAAARTARAAARARIPAPLSAQGSYDVWVTAEGVKGWVPAGFDGV